MSSSSSSPRGGGVAAAARVVVVVASLGLLMVCAPARAQQINFGNLSAGCDDALGFGCANGRCADHVCVCDDLWSKDTDFVILESCETSVVGLYILWAVNIAVVAHVYYASVWVVLLRLENFLEQRKLRRNYGLWDNKGLLAVLCSFLFTSPLQFAMAVYHMANPTARVGFDITATMFFFWAKLTFYTSVMLHQGPILAAALKGERSASKVVLRNYQVTIFVGMLSIFVGSFGFITLGAFSSATFVGEQVQVMRAYYLLQSGALLLTSLNALRVRSKVNTVLDKAKDIVASNHKTEELRAKINKLQQQAIRQSAIQGTVYLLMGAIPYFINKHCYFLPISWLMMPILGKTLAHQVHNDKNSKTVLQRLGIKKTGGSSGDATPSGGAGRSGLGSPSPGGGGTASSPRGNQVTAYDGSSFRSHNPNPNAPAATMVGSSVYVVNDVNEEFKQDNPAVGAPPLLQKQHSIIQKGRKPRHEESQMSSVLSEGTVLEDLMEPAHPMHARFVQFIKSHYAENEFACMQDMIRYKNATAPKQWKKLGRHIVKTFIDPRSARAIDVPDKLQKALLQAAKDDAFEKDTFNEMRRTLMFDLRGNFLHPFEKKMEAADPKF